MVRNFHFGERSTKIQISFKNIHFLEQTTESFLTISLHFNEDPLGVERILRLT